MRKLRRYKLLFMALISLAVFALLVSYIRLYSISVSKTHETGTGTELTEENPDVTGETPDLPDDNTGSEEEEENEQIPDNSPEQVSDNNKNEPDKDTEKEKEIDDKADNKPKEEQGQTDKEKTLVYEEIQAYKDLAYFIDDNLDRYINYKMKNPDYPVEKVIAYVNIGLDHKFYENIRTIENVNDVNVLVNKYRKLPDDFKPELVRLDDSVCAEGRGPQYLRKEAADAFMRMWEDASQLGLNITAYGTYRSIETQDRIWKKAVNSGRIIEDVDSLNARAGHSEHHTGLAIDVIINNYSVEKTKEFEWYSKNAHKYGFIIRYPKGYEHITGYKYEPWHLRYVGEIAAEIYESGLTYEEYYVTVIEPHLK